MIPNTLLDNGVTAHRKIIGRLARDPLAKGRAIFNSKVIIL